MEIVLTIIFSILACMAWFFAVIYTAKHTIGKNCPAWCIFVVLTIAGPLGWATMLVIWVVDVIETFQKAIKRK